jgi:hypothetical protein
MLSCITNASLQRSSFISAASFQKTPGLMELALAGETDLWHFQPLGAPILDGFRSRRLNPEYLHVSIPRAER